MNKPTRILLASHGSPGARAAEAAALNLCATGSVLQHLIVVPELWKGMMGDDWLNNGISRDRFGRYLESELGRELDETRERVETQAGMRKIEYHCDMVVGEPDKCLLNACGEADYDYVVTGSLRPKGQSGLRSRMLTDIVLRGLCAPLLIVPRPDYE